MQRVILQYLLTKDPRPHSSYSVGTLFTAMVPPKVIHSIETVAFSFLCRSPFGNLLRIFPVWLSNAGDDLHDTRSRCPAKNPNVTFAFHGTSREDTGSDTYKVIDFSGVHLFRAILPNSGCSRTFDWMMLVTLLPEGLNETATEFPGPPQCSHCVFPGS